ncbi:MAG: hypothetical protein HQ488_02340 [Parcubacteria group bacterium]|nr:hypothetical protein [Parcubacteria group bacterium]
MRRNFYGIVSTLVFACIIGLVTTVSHYEYMEDHRSWSDTTIPAWQDDAQHVQDLNMFWNYAAGIHITGDPFFEADQQFVQDVSALHIDTETSPELLAQARGRLWHVGDRLYNTERLVELGLLTDDSSRINQSAFHPELLEDIDALHTKGLDAVLSEAPTKPEKPVWYMKTFASNLSVWPVWMPTWLIFSILIMMVYGIVRLDNEGSEVSIYHNVMKRSGEPIGRLLLFLQMAPVLVFMGLVDLTINAVKTGNKALAIARHPNSSEVRLGTKALAALKKAGASEHQIEEAEAVLRSWTLYDPDQAERADTPKTRRDRKLRDALRDVEQLRGQLDAHREVDSAAKPARPRDRVKA